MPNISEQLFRRSLLNSCFRNILKQREFDWKTKSFEMCDAACNFTKINTPPSVFFTFFKLYKWYQIAQHITCVPGTYPNRLLIGRLYFQALVYVRYAVIKTQCLIEVWNSVFCNSVVLVKRKVFQIIFKQIYIPLIHFPAIWRSQNWKFYNQFNKTIVHLQ